MSHHLAGELVFTYVEAEMEFADSIANGLLAESGSYRLNINGFDFIIDGSLTLSGGRISGEITRIIITHENDAAIISGGLNADSVSSLNQLSGTITSFAWGNFDPASEEFSNVKSVSNFAISYAQFYPVGFELLMEANLAVVATDGSDLINGSTNQDVVYSGPGDDTIFGGDGDDILYGEAGDDYLYGGAGNDELYGGTGADYMEGGTGSDTYFVDNVGDQVVETDNNPEGTSGFVSSLDLGGNIDKVFSSIDFALTAFVENLELTDNAKIATGNSLDNEIAGNSKTNTAVFTGQKSDYTITGSNGVIIVTDKTGVDGTDTLTNIERLKFSDGNIALDLDGIAGQAAKLLGVTFGADSVENAPLVGIVIALLDRGIPFQSLMKVALSEAGAATNQEVADLLLTNLTGIAPEETTLSLVTSLMDSGKFSQAQLAVYASTLEDNLNNIDFTGLQHTGLGYTIFG